ncbi:hypothetical protein [Sandaracinus amylolyticus]|uniref:c-type cytochrome n=1 Tax=Sandaracinus amylolyticus TaxID=927083 RepID=UPI001F23BE34|nr:hypothetical protein [Sandaracinus amylolyticus]UJR79710.1 Cytochrome c [Sandaracinus amylolyticus]
MRAWLAIAMVLAACDAPAEPIAIAPAIDPSLEPWSDGWIDAHAPQYLDDPRVRREALEASLTNRENLYSATRLAAYGRERSGWDVLPVWSPRVRRIDVEVAQAMSRGETPIVDAHVAPLWDGARPTTHEAWVALGERVFFELPLRTEPFWDRAIRDAEYGASIGIERAPDGSVPGLVLTRDVEGRTGVGITCALCHSARDASGALIAGRARRSLDYGRARIDFYEARGAAIDPRARERWESWGPGRADVLEDVADLPIAIPDLWGLRHQRLLTQAGTLRHETPIALAIRQETQYVQANHHQTRPPRELMWALVTYLESLEAPAAPAYVGATRDRERGALVFARECGRCHSNAVGSGDLVPIDEIGTDAELATGRARGTGGYRPAPLVRVADAAPYLHHGAVPTLESLLDPARTEPGHRFGMALEDDDRTLLLAYLRSR